MLHPIRHFITITRHRNKVFAHCIRCGIPMRGFLHDLSKYSPQEFIAGMRFWQGIRSPNEKERELYGYSPAWMHHKGRNKHHFEYWTDLNLDTRQYGPVPMPTKYLVEMCMDRIAACKVYQGERYHDGSALEYLEQRSHDSCLMHPDTYAKIHYLLTMLRDKGEKETFRFIREVVLQEKPFGMEQDR